MNKNRRLVVDVTQDGSALVLEFRHGDAASQEVLSEGVVLERTADGEALRLVLSDLREEWDSNLFVSPAVTCTPETCEPMVAPDGTRMFMVGACGSNRPHAIYQEG